MSGSGGGGGSNGGGSASEKTNCQTLTIKTQLSSPKPSVISTLSVDDVLDLILKPPTGPVTAVTKAGDSAGGINTNKLADLIQCMTDGHMYTAKVLSIDGGNCQVLISHV